MSLPRIATREEWLAARKELLAKEKELTRQRDAVNADRRRLPMVRVEKDYAFAGPDGQTSLAGLMGDSAQLVVQHVMFDPEWDKACAGCTASLDELAPAVLAHLRSRDTAFAAVSRAPYSKIAAYRQQRGWTFPWYSSHGSDFNYDFQATVDRDKGQLTYNFRDEPDMLGDEDSTEVPGVSCFLRDGDQVFYTYSTWARGTEVLGSTYSLLDLTALGRQEDWEEPRGRAPRTHGADPTFTD